MGIEHLKPKERIPDTYRNQVVEKLEDLNAKISIIKDRVECEGDRRSQYCYEVNWLLGNYKFTDINGACLWNDLPRIIELDNKIGFWENYPNNRYRKDYTQYFFLEDKEYYEQRKNNNQI